MNILITGGCGFVGTNLSLYLKSKKYNVYTLDNLCRKGSKFNYTVLKKIVRISRTIMHLYLRVQTHRRYFTKKK